MYSFNDFNDYRVQSWMENGVMTRVERAVDAVTGTVKGAVAAVAIGLAVATMATVDLSHTMANQVWEQSSQLDTVSAFANELQDSVNTQLKKFGQVDSPIDSPTLALAEQAIAALQSRASESSSAWAARIVRQG